MLRHTRYQGAIIRDHHILLLLHREHHGGRSYWVIPGGGREAGESEEGCVQREMWEETGLEVRVERLILESEGYPGGVYQALKTFLCTSIGGKAAPGYEPEEEASSIYSIEAVQWLDIRQPGTWSQEIQADPFTYPQLLGIRAALGY